MGHAPPPATVPRSLARSAAALSARLTGRMQVLWVQRVVHSPHLRLCRWAGPLTLPNALALRRSSGPRM